MAQQLYEAAGFIGAEAIARSRMIKSPTLEGYLYCYRQLTKAVIGTAIAFYWSRGLS